MTQRRIGRIESPMIAISDNFNFGTNGVKRADTEHSRTKLAIKKEIRKSGIATDTGFSSYTNQESRLRFQRIDIRGEKITDLFWYLLQLPFSFSPPEQAREPPIARRILGQPKKKTTKISYRLIHGECGGAQENS